MFIKNVHSSAVVIAHKVIKKGEVAFIPDELREDEGLNRLMSRGNKKGQPLVIEVSKEEAMKIEKNESAKKPAAKKEENKKPAAKKEEAKKDTAKK